MNTSLFPEFLSYIKENDLIIKKSMSFYSEDFIDLSIFKLFAKALVYLINEKRENQSLIGLTLEERYKYFTKHYVLTGIILVLNFLIFIIHLITTYLKQKMSHLVTMEISK